MPQSDHPDEVILNPSISSEPFRRRTSVTEQASVPPTWTTNYKNAQKPKSPLINTSDRVLQTPVSRGTRNSALSSNVLESPQKSGPEPEPQHDPAPEKYFEASKPVQQPPTPCLPQNLQNLPPRSPVIPAGAPSLESLSTSERNPPVGFFTARAAESLQNGPDLPMKAPAFNPHSESPSIRKTAGVDHTKTKPVGREAVGMLPQATVARANFINPQSDKRRRVGMPVAAASPLQNRGSYKLPQLKRPAENSGLRLALGDVTNVMPDAGGDAKRLNTGFEIQGANGNAGIPNS